MIYIYTTERKLPKNNKNRLIQLFFLIYIKKYILFIEIFKFYFCNDFQLKE